MEYRMCRVYLASPWFTTDQAEREERIKAKLRSLGFNVWSPKEEAVCDAISTHETRQSIFNGNVEAIEGCDVVFAITDGKDMGTIWEAGFAYGYNKYRATCAGVEPIIIVYYCETLGGGKFNLMLAQSGDIIITEFEDLDKLPDLIENKRRLLYDGLVE